MVLEADSIIYEVDGRKILRGVFLNCRVGEIVGILGRNGSGKSSLFEIIFGTRKAESSFVRIGDKVLTGKTFRSGMVAFMPQFESLPQHLKVKTILWTASIPKNAYADDETILRILDSQVNELSGGESRYLELFVVLHSKCPFVLLDEPFNGISPVVVEDMVKVLKKAATKRGIIISDHNYRAVSQLSDRLMYLNDGRLQEVGDITELKGLYYY